MIYFFLEGEKRMKFGDNLKVLRKSIGLSQEELAERMNVSRQSVSKWETSMSYPEMNNILELCKIFKCDIADLLNDKIIDISSFNDEVKMNIVKLKKEEQNQVKLISKIIEVISCICRIIISVSIGIIIITMIAMPFIIQKTEINGNSITFKGHDEFRIKIDGDVSLEVNGIQKNNANISDEIYKIKELFETNSKKMIIFYVESGFVCLIVFLILILRILTHLIKLFKNINMGSTPFTRENIEHIRKMAYLMIVATLLPGLIGAFFELIMHVDIDAGFELFDIIEILFLLSMAYIFKYGYELQLDSNGKMYDEKK